MNIDKREKELSQEKNPQFLLEKLAKEISKAYLVKIDVISELLKRDTALSLEDFKKEFEQNNAFKQEKWKESKSIEELYLAIKWAKETLRLSTQAHIDILKDELNRIQKWEDFSYITKKVFSENMYTRAENPQNMWDQIAWLCLWLINSWETLIRVLIDIAKGVILTPRDIYLIVSWKWEYKMPNI